MRRPKAGEVWINLKSGDAIKIKTVTDRLVYYYYEDMFKFQFKSSLPININKFLIWYKFDYELTLEQTIRDIIE